MGVPPVSVLELLDLLELIELLELLEMCFLVIPSLFGLMGNSHPAVDVCPTSISRISKVNEPTEIEVVMSRRTVSK